MREQESHHYFQYYYTYDYFVPLKQYENTSKRYQNLRNEHATLIIP